MLSRPQGFLGNIRLRNRGKLRHYDSFVFFMSFVVKKVRVFWRVLLQKIGEKLNYEGGRVACRTCVNPEEDYMKILDDLISAVAEDYKIQEIHTCIHWTAVVSKNCGLSSTFQDDRIPHVPVRDAGKLARKTALEMVEYARSDNLLEASIGMAALNSLIEIDEDRCVELNAFEILAEKGRGKNVCVVGHFPFVPRLRKSADRLWVIEKRPREGDLPAEEAEKVLPLADVVAITGTSFINHTVDELLSLCRKSFVVMVGATSPLSPVLFDYGVDMIAGSKVVDPQKAIHCISEGATFKQIRGIKHLIMKK
jgi:uncharacterized protein (DUF4213/DUF364 family)